MKALVTGGAGFLGSAVVRRLVQEGHEVHVVDNLTTTKTWRNIGDIPGVKFIKDTYLKPGLLKRELRQCDTVFHLAVACLPQGLESPMAMLKANDAGTFSIAEACTLFRRRLVYVSSCEVYGHQFTFPISETATLNPTTTYGASKACGEMWCKAFGYTYDLDYVIVRPFNAIGPGTRTDRYAASFIRFIQLVREDKPPIVYGSGKQTRDFTHVDDLAEGIVLGLRRTESTRIYNIARGEEVSINDLARYVIECYGKTLDVEYFYPGRPGDIQRFWADTTKAQVHLDFKAKKDWKQGVRETVKWYETKVVKG